MIKNYFTKMLLVVMLCVASIAVNAQATHTILVGNTGNDYTPAITNCIVGDTIRFQWVSGFHPTVSDNGTTIPSQDMDGSPGNGSVYKIKMTSVGTVPYYCTAHGGIGGTGMSGVINVSPSNTPLLTENFSYTSGLLLNTQGWSPTGAPPSTVNQITVVTNSLSYTGHPSTGVGNSAYIKNTGEDINKSFTVVTSGSVYASFLVKIDSAKTGDYFFHFGPSPMGTDFKGKVFIKSSGAGYQIGVTKSANAGAAVVYDPTVYTFGSTNMIVVRYTIVAGSANDQVGLFVNPALGGTEPTPVASAVVGETDIAVTGVGTIGLRQGSNTAFGGLTVDGILVGQTWASVTPMAVLSPSVKVNPTQQVVNENVGNATLTFNITNPNASATSFDVVLKSGTATQGSDFTYASTQTLTFPASSSTPVTLNIPIIDDTDQENNETFDLVIRNTTNGATIEADSMHTVTISPSDIVTPVLAFVNTSVTKTEGSGTSVVDVMITNPSASATSIDVVLRASGTTADGSDFTYTSPTTLTFPGSSTATQAASFTITDDNVAEAAETIELVLRNPTNGGLIGNDSVYIITISTNDQPVVAHFMPTTLNVSEGIGNATASIMVMGSNSNSNPTVFDVLIKGGTATGSGTDYTFTTVTVTIPPMKDSTVNIPVTIVNDTDIEGNETIQLVLKNITNGGTIPTDSVLTITITDNDLPYVNIGTLKAVDANGDPTYPLASAFYTRGVVHSGNFRPAGLQFSIVDQTGAITAFKATGGLGYTVAEGDSLAVYGKLSPFNGLNEIAIDSIKVLGTGTVHAPIVTTVMNEVLESDLIEFRNGHLVDPAQWTGAGSGFNVKVTNGTDTIDVRILNSVDLYSQPAPAGTFNFVGIVGQFDNSNPKNSGYQLQPRRATDIYTIPTVSFSAATNTVAESAGQVSVTVNLNKKAITATSVDVIHTSGTATHGSDFNIVLPQTITFNPGDSTGGFIITIIDDSQNEPTENFVLGTTSLVNCTIGGTATQTISITDNDPVGVATSKAGVVNMYPNPSSSQVIIKADETLQQVIVYNTLGQEINNISAVNANEMTLEVSEFAKGIYNVRVITTKGETTQRLMVK
jgi:plastocyanin